MGPTLRIICVNDVYSLENLPARATLVRRFRATATSGECFVPLAGDFVAPSLFSGLDGDRGRVDCLNPLDVTHLSLAPARGRGKDQALKQKARAMGPGLRSLNPAA